jgi:pyrroloquinoline-quinone synthase
LHPEANVSRSAGCTVRRSCISDRLESCLACRPLTLERFRTRAAQERALEILQFKLDILWQMNDAMALALGVAT